MAPREAPDQTLDDPVLAVVPTPLQPAWSAATGFASSLSPHQVAALLLLCIAIVVAYVASLLIAYLPSSALTRAAPLGWAGAGFLLATATTTSQAPPSFSHSSSSVPARGRLPAVNKRSTHLSDDEKESESRRRPVVPQGRSTSANNDSHNDRGSRSQSRSSGGATSAPAPPPAAPVPAVAGHAAAAAAPSDPTPSPALASSSHVAAAQAESDPAPSASPSPPPLPSSSSSSSSAATSSGSLYSRLALEYLPAIDACERQAKHDVARDLLKVALPIAEEFVALSPAGGLAGSNAQEQALLARLPPLAASVPRSISHETPQAAERHARHYPALPEGHPSRVLSSLLWRDGRNLFLRGAKDNSKPMFQEGLARVLASLALFDGDSDAHRYASILYARGAKDQKESIQFAYKIKDHAKKALELRPDDPIPAHILGVWCYEVAGLSWVLRQVATALFGAPPTSSYDEALRYLMQSEGAAAAQTPSAAMVSTRLKIAQTHWQCSRRDEAKAWTAKAFEIKPGAGEDPADLEALRTLASKLGVKVPDGWGK